VTVRPARPGSPLAAAAPAYRGFAPAEVRAAGEQGARGTAVA